MAARIEGDGQQGAWLDMDLPLQNVQVTDVLTGPPLLTGTIDPAFKRLKGPDNRPLLDYGATVIYAEADGQIRGTGIYRNGVWDGPKWRLDCAGFTAYPTGMGYEREASFIQTDPLDIVRHIWAHIQAGGRSNLGLVVDSTTTTPVRLGWFTAAAAARQSSIVQAAEAIRDRLNTINVINSDWTWTGAPQVVVQHAADLVGPYVRGDENSNDEPANPQNRETGIKWLDSFIQERVGGVATDEGPFELNPWTTDDLGSVIDNLSRSTPFEYHERHRWNQGRTAVEHELVFGYPRLGVRRENLRFIIGENVLNQPSITAGEEYANHVRFLGAGEGRDMVRKEVRIDDGRLRRMVTVEDKSVRSPRQAEDLARAELIRRQSGIRSMNVVVRDTPMTPLGSWNVGDEIRLQGDVDWMPIDLWFRVISVTISPDSPELIGLSLLRSDLA
ncbi:hypothetical protein [Geodermatophilus sp. DSM 45219]|uniref:hypothetical protein n=1 Tax=Geodermatophilus sp. DSM 45219 TaxID=1881103 RepID=UPI00115F7DB5|nr:hypothetical protein [Geodermatophilus sp. DSM 45219]